jgi:cyanophycinase
VFDAIHYAYNNGATVAGTSAGAALMCRQMITGNELSDTNYHETFRKLHSDNIEFKEGLGLIDSVIIDQHFLVRSRYNRLLSALEKFPSYPCIGIDEATAVIVRGNMVTVTGESQVIELSKPQGLTLKNNLIKMKDLHFSIYTSGDVFKLR